MLKDAAYAELRYLLNKEDGAIWVWDSEILTHGNLVDRLGLTQDEWEYNTLSGFIHKANLRGIDSKGLRGWIEQRHARAGHSYIEFNDYRYDEKIEVVNGAVGPVTVLINPTRSELRAFVGRTRNKEVRILSDVNEGSMYYWDAFLATHDDVKDELGLFGMETEDIADADEDMLKQLGLI
jgi:hypothetical protein